jgi:hypothetical protein
VVQVDSIKPTLKAPGAKHLKLKHDEPLTTLAFNFNLRRYTMGPAAGQPKFITLKVGRCRLTLLNPR